MEKNEENEKSPKSDEKKGNDVCNNICVKDILKILDTIEKKKLKKLNLIKKEKKVILKIFWMIIIILKISKMLLEKSGNLIVY